MNFTKNILIESFIVKEQTVDPLKERVGRKGVFRGRIIRRFKRSVYTFIYYILIPLDTCQKAYGGAANLLKESRVETLYSKYIFLSMFLSSLRS